MSLRVRRFVAGLLALVLTVPLTAGVGAAPVAAGPPPAGFTEQVVMSGLSSPTKLVFAPDGRILVALKNGVIKIFDSLSDTTPTVFADLRDEVFTYGDLGLLGMTVPPNFPDSPWVYVSYTYDGPIGGSAPTYNDQCAVLGDCMVSNRVSRLRIAGDVMTGSEQVLLHDWCHMYETHAVGDVKFGPDGALYVSGGDGASPSFPDYGQRGAVPNSCGDPGAPVGGTMTPPTAEGGALRSQDVRTPGDPTGLSGTFIRVDPDTGAALPDNPMAGSADPNTRRILAYGLRNPYRWAFRPGTSEVWFGDVGWRLWEEIDRLADPLAGPVENFGWPCYEGEGRQNGYDSPNLALCESLYAQGAGAVVAPQYTYHHAAAVVSGDGCPTGGSSPSALAFYPTSGGNYPATYRGALFWGDYARQCIWAMLPGAGGVPDRDHIVPFTSTAATPVDLQIGPDNRLYYVDHSGGTIRRFDYNSGNQPPTAALSASPTAGNAPLTVSFDASGSTDPDAGEVLSYQWDFTNNGSWDASGATASFTYPSVGTYTARLRVSDLGGLSAEKTVQILVGTGAPTAVIDTPAGNPDFKVGDTISFGGHATDPQQGNLPASALHWQLLLEHCYAADNCHTHNVQEWDGVASGTFTAPDHEYPSYLELKLTATDNGGLTHTVTRRLDPRSVDLTFTSSPPGLELSVNGVLVTTPATRTVLAGSTNAISAPSPQSGYAFGSWSDGGAATHVITAGTAAATYHATFNGTHSGGDGYEMSDATGQPFVGADATTLPLAGDDVKQQVSVPFAFPFYGVPQSSVWVTSNGFLSFADPGQAGLIAVNGALPSGSAPNNAIYPFWDDLVLRGDSSIRTETLGSAPNRRFVVEWHNTGHYGSNSARLSVSAVLHESGRIDFNYDALNSAREDGNSATVGIEDGAGASALTYSFNQASLDNGKRVTFTPTGDDPDEPPAPTTGTVRGVVTDAATGSPIVGAAVTLAPGGGSTTTTGGGAYEFGAVPPGAYTVTATSSGESAAKQVTVTAGGTATVNLAVGSPPAGYTKTTESRAYAPVTGGVDVPLTGDDATTRIDLPFAVPFWGQPRSEAWISTNGFLSFADPDWAQPENVGIPAAALPNAGVYPYWDDLVVRGDSTIRTKVTGAAPNRQLVVEWNNIGQYGSASARVSVQATLGENGTIVFNYSSLAPSKTRERGDSATVGLENPTGTAAVQHSLNQPVLADNQAIVFTPN
ncbi:PQQ-dependent sugar dehydrogenase [Asanoa sp. WMMD1127]|uniref:PQQ-dependent sugar dehydrogenase n=1 Tax=Asanoa sp. WMMD1127 TaxID=3016107 RepID=UPI002416931A|nr:PQQ-dependent sugar dehydrogenase [Asanoa sp. WMMD1127]MDG4823353.1 PQQ-dependent sugar dehydrogenase [Asanoa sp. WMMD1127]